MSKVPHSFLNIFWYVHLRYLFRWYQTLGSNAVRFCFLIQTVTKPFTDDLSFQPKTHPRRNVKILVRVCDTELGLPPFASKLLMFFGIISRLEAFQHSMWTPNKCRMPRIFLCVFFCWVLSKTQNPGLDFPRPNDFVFFAFDVFFRGRTLRRNSKVRSPLEMNDKKKVVSMMGFLPGFFSQLSNGSWFFFGGWSNVWFQQIVHKCSWCGKIWWVGRRFSVGWLLQHLDTFVMEKRTQQGILYNMNMKEKLATLLHVRLWFILQYGCDLKIRTWRRLLLCFDRAWYRRSGELKHWWTRTNDHGSHI